MATTRIGDPPRPVATPIPGALWEGDVVDVTTIATELRRLWLKVGDGVTVGADAHDEPRDVMILVRATTLNLVAVTRDKAAEEEAIAAVLAMSDFHPSRATILFADPARTDPDDDTLHVRAMLVEQAATKSRPVVRFELVVVEGSAANEPTLASVVAPLLVVDLPDFLWWSAGSIVGSGLFADLWTRSDRVIVDTAGSTRPAAELRALATFATGPDSAAAVSDFAWSRTRDWRKMVAQFFDAPAARDALPEIDRVEITYLHDAANDHSGFTGALLTAGWLASHLGWHAPGPLVATRGEAHGWHLTFRAGPATEPREIDLTLHAATESDAWPSLAKIVLSVGDGESGRFSVERTETQELHAVSRAGGTTTEWRSVFDRPKAESQLLAGALQMYSRDPVFEAALRAAAGIAPAGERFGSEQQP